MIFRIEGTLGQNAAGTQMSGGSFTQKGGFWNPILRPTAATVSLSGRAVGSNKAGLANAIVTLTGGRQTVSRLQRTNNFGNFRFDELEAGFLYILSIRAKGIVFEEDTYVFTLNDDLNDITFRGIEH
jgi:hypothetical protein